MLVTKSNSVQRRLIQLYANKPCTWQKIAEMPDYFGIPKVTLWAISKGRPVPKKWRKRLGLPPLATVEACLHCGKAHERLKQCQPRPARKRPARIAVSKDDAGKAALSLVNNVRFDIDELIVELERLTNGR